VSDRVLDDAGLAAEIASGLAGSLRARSVTIELDAVLEFARALLVLGDLGKSDVYWAGRATLIRSPADFGAYDAAFSEYFGLDSAGEQPIPDLVPVPVPTSGEEGPEPDRSDDGQPSGDRFSSTERLGRAELGTLDSAQRGAIAHLIVLLGAEPASYASRRRERSSTAGGALDLRRTVARLLRTDGELIERRYRRRRTRVRRIVLLCDISGSMEPYAPAFLCFSHALVRARPNSEVFAMGTQLTRLTSELRAFEPGIALVRAGEAISDWSGGTRLGESFREFNNRSGLRATARSAVVVICSDGIDRGDPAVIGTELGRLARVAHRVVWVNPLKSTSGYEPLARGMAAALPFLDDFLDGHSLTTLEPLARVLARR
jgi:uncharacterized protein with von Willebrand factor type A (vWA) domain